ncbi:hypothetical protein CY0110_17847 [Crocosphaera chwakensis CCY0110]|uniref:Uncharacterized protein n=1 Tax=Crocosphaera chwakensis CCY0110 TaxID=391612 RepID=A3IIQ1_9CHRO|nr:hypothetical protein CY0110_17847 [Crocosphaera chwakensis CCY0110]
MANTKAWMALVNNPKAIRGNGTNKGTKNTSTATTNSSAKMFPKRRKLRERGLVKSSKILMGRRTGIGWT